MSVDCLVFWKNVCSAPLPTFKSDFVVELCEYFLYILGIHSLSDLSFASMFYHSVKCFHPWWLRGLSVSLQCGRPGFDPWIRKIPWRRKWQPTPVFLPGESHGWRSLEGCSPQGHKESDMTEQFHFLSFFFFLSFSRLSSCIVDGFLCCTETF